MGRAAKGGKDGLGGSPGYLAYSLAAFNELDWESATVEAVASRVFRLLGRNPNLKGRAIGTDGKPWTLQQLAERLKMGKTARVLPALRRLRELRFLSVSGGVISCVPAVDAWVTIQSRGQDKDSMRTGLGQHKDSMDPQGIENKGSGGAKSESSKSDFSSPPKSPKTKTITIPFVNGHQRKMWEDAYSHELGLKLGERWDVFEPWRKQYCPGADGPSAMAYWYAHERDQGEAHQAAA